MLKKQRKEKIFDAADLQRRSVSAKTYQEIDKENKTRSDEINSAGYINKYDNDNISGKIGTDPNRDDPRVRLLENANNVNNNNESLNDFGKDLNYGNEEEQRTAILRSGPKSNDKLFKKRDWRNNHHSHMMASYFEIGVVSPNLIDGAVGSENTPVINGNEDDQSDFIDAGDINGFNTITSKMNNIDGYWRPSSSVSIISIEPLDDWS